MAYYKMSTQQSKTIKELLYIVWLKIRVNLVASNAVKHTLNRQYAQPRVHNV